MKYEVEIAPRAQLDLLEIVEWIGRESPQSAENWVNRLLDAIGSLATFPQRCALAPENDFHKQQVRHLLFGGYRVLFSVQGPRVSILHIRHGARRSLTDTN